MASALQCVLQYTFRHRLRLYHLMFTPGTVTGPNLTNFPHLIRMTVQRRDMKPLLHMVLRVLAPLLQPPIILYVRSLSPRTFKKGRRISRRMILKILRINLLFPSRSSSPRSSWPFTFPPTFRPSPCILGKPKLLSTAALEAPVIPCEYVS